MTPQLVPSLFHVPPGVFHGVIGGPPCRAIARAVRQALEAHT